MIDSLMSSAYFIKAVVVWWVLILLGKLIKNHQFWRYIAILRIWKIIIKSQHSVLLTVSTGIEMMLFQSVKILEDGIDDGDELSSIVSIWISLTFSSSNMHSSREITALFEVMWLLLLFEFSFDWSSDDLVDWIKKNSRNVVWICSNDSSLVIFGNKKKIRLFAWIKEHNKWENWLQRWNNQYKLRYRTQWKML